MSRRQARFAVFLPAIWAGMGIGAIHLELLHVSLMPAWLLTGALLWSPLEVSLLTVMLEERHPRRVTWFAFAEGVALYVGWRFGTAAPWI